MNPFTLLTSIYEYMTTAWTILYYRFFHEIDLSKSITYDPDASIIDDGIFYD